MLPSAYPEVQATPNLKQLLAVQVDMQFLIRANGTRGAGRKYPAIGHDINHIADLEYEIHFVLDDQKSLTSLTQFSNSGWDLVDEIKMNTSYRFVE